MQKNLQETISPHKVAVDSARPYFYSGNVFFPSQVDAAHCCMCRLSDG